MRTVWSDTFVSDDVLTRCISKLRRVFGDDPKEPHVIETIPKSGYRLIACVSFNGAERDAAPGPACRYGGIASHNRCPARLNIRGWIPGANTSLRV